MTRASQQLEKKVQRDIEATLGAEPDLLLLKNSVGQAEYVDGDGKSFRVPYGLGNGSPDLVGLLRVEVLRTSRKGDSENPLEALRIRTVAVWFCLEVKADTGTLSPEQEKAHKIWRRFGAFIATVRSVAEARAALDRARGLEIA